jgi:two-component system phosphate regulon response regulator PhoB
MSDKPGKVLVVDDEADVTALIAYHLKSKGFIVEELNDPNASLGVARRFMPDLIVLDVMMPDINGLQVCRLLRADPLFREVPVVFLTAKTEEADRVQGLEIGADDYICKPFSPKEVVLRVQALLKRVGPRETTPKILKASKVALDCDRHEVRVAGKPVTLTATEFRLLQLLMERRGRVQTREHLLIHVWNYDTEIETRTVDTHVRRLREKLGTEADWIETIRGVGYRMAERRP